METTSSIQSAALNKPKYFTPLMIGVLALSFSSVAFLISGIGSNATGAAIQGLVSAALYLAAAYPCYRLVKLPNEKAVTRFWKVAFASHIFRCLGELFQVYAVIVHSPLNPEIQGTVTKALYGVALLLIAREFMFFPLNAKSRQEQVRLSLDLLTVMVAVIGVSWYYILAPSLDGPLNVKEVGAAIGQFILVLIYANIVKLILSNTALLTRNTSYAAIAAAAVFSAPDVIAPMVSGTEMLYWVFVLRIVACAANCFVVHNQHYDLQCDADALIKKNRKPYSLVPYTAMSGLYALLVLAIVKSSILTLDVAGLLVAAVVTAGIVVVRQLNAFSDNAQLLKRLDENLHELQESYDREKESQRIRTHLETELRHVQKLDAIGRLAGGVAKEIDAPVQHLRANMTFLDDSLKDLTQLVDGCRNGKHVSENSSVDVNMVVDRVPIALDDCTTGLVRVAEIVRSLKSFSGNDLSEGYTISDVNEIITDTLVISRNEIEPFASVSFKGGEIPSLRCNPRDLGQVWLNLLLNAAYAIKESGRQRGEIAIRTYCDGSNLVVEVADNGIGIPHETAERIFDPFFSTKPNQTGTGQGLTIARSIVESHGGTIAHRDNDGGGALFVIQFPVAKTTGKADATNSQLENVI